MTHMKAILKLMQAKPNDQQVKASFKNAEGVEVKEMIGTFCDRDAKEILINLEKELIRLGNCYDLFKDGKWKPLAQLRGRALGGHIKCYWSKIIEKATITQTGTAAYHSQNLKSRSIKSMQSISEEMPLTSSGMLC